ncbi:MAG: DUF6364 family protein [Prevotellaceae bacterium]|jgi:hypothetical protein|nr:DUF6364 family protein [Prevotellaceae bacterium]
MNTTLKINIKKSVVEQAEIYASRHNLNLPGLVEHYLISLVRPKQPSELGRKLSNKNFKALKGKIQFRDDYDYKSMREAT